MGFKSVAVSECPLAIVSDIPTHYGLGDGATIHHCFVHLSELPDVFQTYQTSQLLLYSFGLRLGVSLVFDCLHLVSLEVLHILCEFRLRFLSGFYQSRSISRTQLLSILGGCQVGY